MDIISEKRQMMIWEANRTYNKERVRYKAIKKGKEDFQDIDDVPQFTAEYTKGHHIEKLEAVAYEQKEERLANISKMSEEEILAYKLNPGTLEGYNNSTIWFRHGKQHREKCYFYHIIIHYLKMNFYSLIHLVSILFKDG